MELYLMRHGEAIDRSLPEAADDAARWLTEEGREETSIMARFLHRLGVKPDLALSSPLVRARQTAEVVADLIGPSRIELCEDLVYGGSFSGILQAISEHAPARRVLLTGHMPSIGRLVGWLAWNQRDSEIRMRTAAICRIDLPDDGLSPGYGDIRWLMSPKQAAKTLEG
jgi:phosphohistidine phosphatase